MSFHGDLRRPWCILQFHLQEFTSCPSVHLKNMLIRMPEILLRGPVWRSYQIQSFIIGGFLKWGYLYNIHFRLGCSRSRINQPANGVPPWLWNPPILLCHSPQMDVISRFGQMFFAAKIQGLLCVCVAPFVVPSAFFKPGYLLCHCVTKKLEV